MSNPQTPVPASTAALAERITKLTQQISRHELGIKRSARLTGAIGLIALVAISIYFYVGYVMIARELQPERLVPAAIGFLEQNLEPAREALVTQIRNSSPAWAEQVSKKAQEAIPILRAKLEDYILTESDQLIVQVSTTTEDHFRKAIQENRDVVEKGFKELATDEKLSEESLNALVQVLEQEMKTSLHDQATTLLETLRTLSHRAQRLSIGMGLDEEERCMRRIAMIARRLQLTEADPKPIKPPVVEISSSKSDSKSDPETKPTPDFKADDKSSTDREKSEKPAADKETKPAQEGHSEPKSEGATGKSSRGSRINEVFSGVG